MWIEGLTCANCLTLAESTQHLLDGFCSNFRGRLVQKVFLEGGLGVWKVSVRIPDGSGCTTHWKRSRVMTVHDGWARPDEGTSPTIAIPESMSQELFQDLSVNHQPILEENIQVSS